MNPNQVPINYTLTLDQVNLVLEGLGELPMKRVEQFSAAFRSVALQALKAAEEIALAEVAAAPEVVAEAE